VTEISDVVMAKIGKGLFIFFFGIMQFNEFLAFFHDLSLACFSLMNSMLDFNTSPQVLL
jgi:hypothetical protein